MDELLHRPTMSVYNNAREVRMASATNKQNNALKHFNYFLKDYCVQIGVDVVTAETIAYKGLGSITSQIDTNKFWDEMMGCVVTYLCTAARYRCDPNSTEFLGEPSADGYFSSTDEYFRTKFRHETKVPVIDK